MKKLFAALSVATILAFANIPYASALTFVTSASALAGNPAHVTVYDSAENLIPNSSVSWSLANGGVLPATLTVTSDPAGGFSFVSSTTGSFNVKAMVGAASGTLMLTFTGLKFTNP
jgi:hypothetical protein